MDCTICCEKINKTTRKPIECSFCAYVSCLSCTKTYLLQTIHQPHCMNCRKEWTWDILVTRLPINFLKEEYRNVRETYLFEEEKTYLPALQEQAEHILRIKHLNKQMMEIDTELVKNNENEQQMVFEQRKKERELKEKRTSTFRLINKLESTSKIKNIFRVSMKCPFQDCRGFLSDSYSCGLCLKKSCKSCHEELVEEHKCNPDSILTVNLLKETTKPCPKCHILIYKTDGCDQMFCTQCHTAFSWKTGQVEKGVIHNPHYYEALRAGNILEERHRQPDCEAIPSFNSILNIMKGRKELRDIQHYYQRIVHNRQVTMVNIIPEDWDKTRLSYLTNEIDEKKFKQKCYVRYQRELRLRDERQILNTYITIGEEFFRTMSKDNVTKIIEQLKKLTELTVDSILKLDDIYPNKGVLSIFDFQIY